MRRDSPVGTRSRKFSQNRLNSSRFIQVPPGTTMAAIVIPVNESLHSAEEVLKETAISSVVEVLTDVDSESNSGRSFTASHNSTLRRNIQEPIAVVGMSCRLPGHCTNIEKLWSFISSGSVARNDVPQSRWHLDGHHDGSAKPHTIRSPGGMFLEDIDLHAVDTQFFNLSRADAIAMDPQQRQLLEVVVECLENSGITLESISDKQIGCFTASYAVGECDCVQYLRWWLTGPRLCRYASTQPGRETRVLHNWYHTRELEQSNQPFPQHQRT